MLRKCLLLILGFLLLLPIQRVYAQSGGVLEKNAEIVIGPDLKDPLLRGQVAQQREAELKSRHSLAVPAPATVDLSLWPEHVLQLGEEVGCFARRGGIAWESVAQANHILNPSLLEMGQVLHIPDRSISTTMKMAYSTDTPLATALTYGVSHWAVKRLNPLPAYTGAPVVLPADGSESACLPYPLVNLSFAKEDAVRGLTSVLLLETAEPATCEITYIDQTEPCYTEDDTHLYALLGFSALMDAGEYLATVHLRTGEVEVAFDIPLDIQPGRYGFQRINPPQGLSGLMDGELMSNELAYLEHWRGIRSPVRMWQYPLDFPLPFNVSISAGYGDRRSYGGIVDGYHSGIDYRAWRGVPVLAPAEGVVILAEKLEVRGNAVLIDHGWGLVSGYWHLSKIEVQVGQHLKRGQEFAQVGNTGLSTGSHLHFELWVNGVSVDGRQWLDAAGLGNVELPVPVLPDPMPLRDELVE